MAVTLAVSDSLTVVQCADLSVALVEQLVGPMVVRKAVKLVLTAL